MFAVVIYLSQSKVPVILAGCKVDLSDKQQQAGLENVLDFIMCTFREVEIYLECSALHRIKVKCVVKLCVMMHFQTSASSRRSLIRDQLINLNWPGVVIMLAHNLP